MMCFVDAPCNYEAFVSKSLHGWRLFYTRCVSNHIKGLMTKLQMSELPLDSIAFPGWGNTASTAYVGSTGLNDAPYGAFCLGISPQDCASWRIIVPKMWKEHVGIEILSWRRGSCRQICFKKINPIEDIKQLCKFLFRETSEI